MSRRCERPGCSAAATVAYGFAADRQLAWLADLDQDRNAAGALCESHAAAMILPRGWWLDDRRTDEPTLFRSPEHRPAGGARHHHAAVGDDPRRRRDTRRAHELVIGEQLALDADVVPPGDDAPEEPCEPEPTGVGAAGAPVDDGEPDAASPAGDPPAVDPWMPSFDVTDDLGGLLDVSTPLLSRAFGRRPRSTTRPVDRG